MSCCCGEEGLEREVSDVKDPRPPTNFEMRPSLEEIVSCGLNTETAFPVLSLRSSDHRDKVAKFLGG